MRRVFVELAPIGLRELVHRVVGCAVLRPHGFSRVAALLEFGHQGLLRRARRIKAGLGVSQALLHAPVFCDGGLLALQAPQGLLCLVQIPAQGTSA